MEKVIQEFKVVETDDGFRIEIKGDKEKMREFVMGMDPRRWGESGFGPWGGSRRRHRRVRGPWMFAGRMPFSPPWMWWCGEEEEESEAKHRVKVDVEGEDVENV